MPKRPRYSRAQRGPRSNIKPDGACPGGESEVALSLRGGRGRSGAAASWRVGAMSSSAKNALRIVFAWAVTALVAISVYYGMLWLFGAHAARADWIQGSEPDGTRLNA